MVAYLKTDVPIYIWSDVLYSSYYKHYYEKDKIYKETTKHIRSIEKAAIQNANKIFLTSKWAVSIAKKKYQNNTNKFRLMNFGANLNIFNSRNNIKKSIARKLNQKLKLLVIAVDWKRKGLYDVYKLKEIIEKKNLDVSLTIVGAKNIIKIKDKNINFENFLNKTYPKDEKKLIKIISESNFNLLLSKSEAYGIVLVESIALGTPNIVYDVGGMNEIVKNKKSGLIYKKNTSIKKIAEDVIKIYKNKKKYNALCLKSLNHFNKNFQYNKIINQFLNHLK